MNKYFIAALLLFHCVGIVAQQHPEQQYKLIAGNNIVASKNYYFLALLQENKAAKELIESDSLLTLILQQKRQQIITSLAECKNGVACFTDAMEFSEDEITIVSERLSSLYTSNNALGKLVQEHLIASGTYILFQQLPPKEFLIKAWEQDVRGINFAISVYGKGNKANYPNIDSIAFSVSDKRYASLVYNLVYSIQQECANAQLFFLPSLTAALRFLEINERNNAGDYEPMAAGENKAAVEKIKTTVWNKYKYSLIMIPGAGPEEPTVALSAEGMIRCRLAALQFNKGLAPFIVTSGGRVHPYKTKYCEALEMKHFMVAQLHVPAAAIIIDPHARHTTTNMRNTARLMFRYGFPFNKPAITCTTHGQSSMIETTLLARCMKELNEVPYKDGVRLSETEMEFYPLIEALHINPSEPMDP